MRIKLADRKYCNGCSSCAAICPKAAISMIADAEGFKYPNIDTTRCCGCNKCVATCPALNRLIPRTPMLVYAAKAIDDMVRLASSSGGVFPLLAKEIIGRGGTVFGAGWNKTWRVVHMAVDSEVGLSDIMGSKYVQSDVCNTYSEARCLLDKGQYVMFIGTPCQIAGLKAYLGKDYIKLLAVEIICHGVPSPLAWEKYLEQRIKESLEDKTSSSQCSQSLGAQILRISSRNKKYGWKRYALSVNFANKKVYLRDVQSDIYLRGFLAELYTRPSCHGCLCRELRSGADITLGDYWGVDGRFPSFDDDKGVSLVLINTLKGMNLFESISCSIVKLESDYSHACIVNPSLAKSVAPHPRRNQFFRRIGFCEFDNLVTDLLKPSITRRLLTIIGRTVRRVLK